MTILFTNMGVELRRHVGIRSHIGIFTNTWRNVQSSSCSCVGFDLSLLGAKFDKFPRTVQGLSEADEGAMKSNAGTPYVHHTTFWFAIDSLSVLQLETSTARERAAGSFAFIAALSPRPGIKDA